jgi:hypothetical protein
MVRRMISISFVNDTQTKSDHDFLFQSNWSFEKCGARSTRFEALTGKPYRVAMGLAHAGGLRGSSAGVSRASSRLPSLGALGETADMQYIHRTPTKPLLQFCRESLT